MQVVVKTPPIDVSVEGSGLEAFAGIIKRSIPDAHIVDDDEAQDIDEWDYYAGMRSRLTPAKALKIRRENAGLSQEELAKKCGVTAAEIALMEAGEKPIDRLVAANMAKSLDCGVEDFS